MDLDGKVAVVTGAGSGIGYAIAERFAADGAAVCVNYLGYEDDAKALAQRLPKAIAFKADVSKCGGGPGPGRRHRQRAGRRRCSRQQRRLGTLDALS